MDKNTENYFNEKIKYIFQDHINKEKQKLLEQYENLMKERADDNKKEEERLQHILAQFEATKFPELKSDCDELEEEIRLAEAELEKIKDEIDTITIQSLSENEAIKIEYAEKAATTQLRFKCQIAECTNKLEAHRVDYKKEAQNIQNAIMQLKAGKSKEYEETKTRLQKQIVDAQQVLAKTLNEQRGLITELNNMRSKQKTIRQVRPASTPRVMEFKSDDLIYEPKNNNNNEDFCSQSLTEVDIRSSKNSGLKTKFFTNAKQASYYSASNKTCNPSLHKLAAVSINQQPENCLLVSNSLSNIENHASQEQNKKSTIYSSSVMKDVGIYELDDEFTYNLSGHQNYNITDIAGDVIRKIPKVHRGKRQLYLI